MGELIHIIVVCLSGVIYFIFYMCSLLFDEENEGTLKLVVYVNNFIFVISALFLIFGYVHIDNKEWTYPEKPNATEHILSLNDNNLVQGKTYIHQGYIKEDLYYQYIVDVGKGGYKANKVPAKDTTLYYSKNNFRVEWYKKRKSWLWFEQEAPYYKIYIPNGSIETDYSVDLK